METTIGSRLKHAWNAFLNRDPTIQYRSVGIGNSYRPDRLRLTKGNERSIITSINNRIAMDAAAIDIEHVQLDDNNRYDSTIDSNLNKCLTLEANIDQTGRAFIQDAVMSLLDEGVVALVPIDYEELDDSFEIYTIRTGKILEWYPKHIKVRVFNEQKGRYEEVIVAKETTAIVENPLYAVMNEPNSTMQRLIRKLKLLDVIDEESGSGKWNLIIQLPYQTKTSNRQKQAEDRRKEVEMQLTESKYGVAYIDGTEKVIQLNRSVENNMMTQIEYLTSMLNSQLGITKEIMEGTADENTMNNYYARTIQPILSAIVDEMKRKFLSQTARSKKESICFFRDPFELIPTTALADLSDKLTRNEIVTSNEVRQFIGIKPSKDPKADELRNRNISASSDTQHVDVDGNPINLKKEVKKSK